MLFRSGLNTAVLNVDYARTADASSATYRNDNRIPITPNADFDRTGWTMTENYRLGWIAGGEWFNYTRVIPPAKYRVYAGISYGGTGDALRSRVRPLVRVGQPLQRAAEHPLSPGAQRWRR